MRTLAKLLAAAVLLLLLCPACKESHVIPNTNIMPPSLLFYLLDKQGHSLLTRVNEPIKVYGFRPSGEMLVLGQECSGGDCTMVREASSSYGYGYLSYDASLASSVGVKTWYIELNGKTDTLYYDVQRVRPNDPLDQFNVARVSFNGEPLDLTIPPPYTLQRRH